MQSSAGWFLMLKEIGISIIGLSRLGGVHLHNLSRNIAGAKLTAVCDIKEELAEAKAKEYGVRAYTDYKEMLKDSSIDAVCVVTSTDTHLPIVMDAAGAGKAIFCEKPMAPSIKEARQMTDAVQRAKVIFQVGYMRRFDPAYAEAKEIIDKGAIGKPVMFKSTSRDPFPPPEWACDPTKGGGLYIDMHTHDFDLARWFMNDEIKRVYAEDGVLVFKDYTIPGFVDNVITTLKFRHGALGVVDGSDNARYGYDIRTEILGSEGAVFIGELKHRAVTVCTAAGGISQKSTFQTDERCPHFMRRFNEAYIEEMKHFIDCVIKGTTPLVTEKDGEAALEIAEAAQRSSREQKAFDLPLR